MTAWFEGAFRRPEDGLPIPLQLQVLEGDHLDDATSLISGKDRNGNREVRGVLFDAVGRRTGYRSFLEHPGRPAHHEH
ncbi:MAG: phage portal protein [Planctomycetota bacterium]